MRSLRLRLLVGTTLAALAIYAGAGVILFFVIRASLVGEFERTMEARVQALARRDGSG